ncbi:hypothetical protein V1294_000572 [Bradyrhizobium sp. AZCC 1678]|uniref:hypothetical protein n=1 Tax=Bradyrhizobium sp. AZCC 1678 TaxID=3117030 RepID=UPI002FF228D5
MLTTMPRLPDARFFPALKTGGCAIPPMTRHVVFPFLVVVFIGRTCTARQYLPG